MKKLMTIARLAGLAVLATTIAIPASASASGPGRIRECGRTSVFAVNVTTRFVDCRDARRFARRVGFLGWGAVRLTVLWTAGRGLIGGMGSGEV